MTHGVPPYFDYLLDDFRRGRGTRSVHLGYWDTPDIADDDFALAQARLDERLLGMADLADGQVVLDIGCGFGGTLERIDRGWSGMDLTGVNIDSRQLDVCRQLVATGGNRLRWEQADACRLPFATASVDRVFCIEAMFHFPSRRAFFLEAARVLKPGGVLVASDILIRPSARDLGVPGLCVEAPVQDGFGPWPDFWGEDADHPQLATAAGLRCSAVLDATAQTAPSHRHTVPANASADRDSGNISLRAAIVLAWLHREGHLRYPCFRFDKPVP